MASCAGPAVFSTGWFTIYYDFLGAIQSGDTVRHSLFTYGSRIQHVICNKT